MTYPVGPEVKTLVQVFIYNINFVYASEGAFAQVCPRHCCSTIQHVSTSYVSVDSGVFITAPTSSTNGTLDFKITHLCSIFPGIFFVLRGRNSAPIPMEFRCAFPILQKKKKKKKKKKKSQSSKKIYIFLKIGIFFQSPHTQATW